METRTTRWARPVESVDFRHLVVATTAMVYLTVLLGVATRATGSGLACNANWPLCDGGLLNLFPASMPSAFEWIHRVVAMVTGFFIVGAAIAAWRGRVSRRITWAVTIGVVLLPLQVMLGRETVLAYTPPVLAAHYWVAMAIYGAFVVATILAWRSAIGFRHVRAAAGAAVVLFPAQFVLAPPIVSRYSPPVQSAQYAVILALFAAVAVVAIAGRERRPERYLALVATALVPIVVYLGRQRIGFPDVFTGPHQVASGLLFVAIAGLAASIALDSYRDRTDPGEGRRTRR